jgi:hypothetical protein
MDPEDIRRYAARDWQEIARAKDRYWIDRKRTMSPAESLAFAESLRLYVRSIRQDWPSDEERRDDLETHARVSAMLNLVR